MRRATIYVSARLLVAIFLLVSLTRVHWDIAVAVIISCIWIGIIAFLLRKQQLDAEKLPIGLPTSEERDAALERLWSLYKDYPDEEPVTALFLMDQSKAAYDGWIESNVKLEAKATWLTGFLAGGAGLLTVIESLHGGKSPGLHNGPFLDLALCGAFGALVACIYLLRPKLRPHPNVADYISARIALRSKARFHIAMSLAEDYNAASLEIARLRRFDPVAWTAAQVSLATAVVSILLHLSVSIGTIDDSRNMLQCSGIESPPERRGTYWKSYCKEYSMADKPEPTSTPPPRPPSGNVMHEGWKPTARPSRPA